MVVDEPSIEKHAAVSREGARDDIRGIGVCPPVRRWTQAPLRVRFQDEPAEIRNGAIDLIRTTLPERRYARVQRVECIQPADLHRTAEIDRQRQRDSPRPEGIGNARELWDDIGRKRTRIRHYVVYC